MIRKVRVENYKSIPNLTVDLGRVTVLIGANGSGKTNILEALALASAAAQNKLVAKKQIQSWAPPEFFAEHLLTNQPALAEQLVHAKSGTLPGFLVYASENSALRTFQTEGQILPLGIRGEGLFAHLKGLNSAKQRRHRGKEAAGNTGDQPE